MPQPPGMVTVRIDPHTGLLANPNSTDAKFEIFRQKYAPTVVAPTSATTAGVPSGGDDNSGNGEAADEHLF